MKEQLDLRTLIIYLLNKLKQLGIDDEHSTYIKTISVLLSKQILFIVSQERVKDPLFTLEPNDTSYFLRNFTYKEIREELIILLKSLKNIEVEPYSQNVIFQEVHHRYIISLIDSINDRLSTEKYKPNES